MCAAPILQLLCKILHAETACVTMIVEDGVMMQQGTGLLTEKAVYPQPGVCHWMLVPDRPQAMIVEDMRLDARLAPKFLTCMQKAPRRVACHSMSTWHTVQETSSLILAYHQYRLCNQSLAIAIIVGSWQAYVACSPESD